MKIRNGGWTFAPQAMLADHGTFYLIDLRVFTRRIHKSSIDKEYEVNVILGLAWIVLITTFQAMKWFGFLFFRLLRKF